MDSEFGVGLQRSREFIRQSRIFMHEKPESSVGYRSICFRSKVRLLYGTRRSLILTMHGVCTFGSLRFRDFCSANIVIPKNSSCERFCDATVFVSFLFFNNDR